MSTSRTGPSSPSRVYSGILDHRQAAALRGDRVEFSGRRLLPGAQRVELALPGVGVDDWR